MPFGVVGEEVCAVVGPCDQCTCCGCGGGGCGRGCGIGDRGLSVESWIRGWDIGVSHDSVLKWCEVCHKIVGESGKQCYRIVCCSGVCQDRAL